MKRLLIFIFDNLNNYISILLGREWQIVLQSKEIVYLDSVIYF